MFFVIVYFMLVTAAIITGVVYFCISHPETAKLIGACAIVVIVFLGMVFFSMPAKAEGSFYPRAAIITALDINEDLVTCVDAAGRIWQFYGVEDFDIGDVVAMILWNSGTPSVFDDEIIDATYAGTLDQLGAWIK